MNEEVNRKLSEYLQNVGRNTEFEIRFGKFVYDRNSNRSKFESNVEIEFFFRLKQFLIKNVPNADIFTKETSHENNKGIGKIRKILTTDSTFEKVKQEEILLKNSYKIFNMYDFDIRFALASEQILNKQSVSGVNWDAPEFFRFKHRTRFTTSIGYIDLTIVKEGKTENEARKSTSKYEVEFEVIKNNKETVLELLTILVKMKQDNFFVISNNEKKEVFNKYKALTSVPYFIGAQPETLQKDQLTNLYKELYSVTDKADGEIFYVYR